MSFSWKTLLCFCLPLMLSSCASLRPEKPRSDWTELQGLKVGNIIETATGKTLTQDELFEQLAKCSLVYVGEVHTSLHDHLVQLKILEGLHSRGGPLVPAMEMFSRESQPILDRFSNGELNEEQFLKELKWDETWGYPFDLYRMILTFAQEKKLRIVGLNAPRDVVRKIAREGMPSLTPQEKTRIAADFSSADESYKKSLEKQYEEHAHESIKGFDTFLEAQLTWEHTMAETLARELSLLPRGGKIVTFIGKGHMSNRAGVPRWTFNLTAHDYKTVAPMPINYPDSLADPMLADFVWITEKLGAEHRGRLGIMLRPAPDKGGLEVLNLMPGSPAEKAGIQVGDVIVSINAKKVTDFEGLRDELKKEQKSHELIIHRGGKQIPVTVVIDN